LELSWRFRRTKIRVQFIIRPWSFMITGF
jgi:hypothetical protein